MEALHSCGKAVHEVTSARLVHHDFHPGNLLHVGAERTGLLDLEWSFAGDPLYDLFDWYPKAEQWPGSRTPFLQGYGKLAFSEAEIRRLEVYQILNDMTLCVVACRHFPAEEARQYREATPAHLHHLEES